MQCEPGPQHLVAAEYEKERADGDPQPGEGAVVGSFGAGATHRMGLFSGALFLPRIFLMTIRRWQGIILS